MNTKKLQPENTGNKQFYYLVNQIIFMYGVGLHFQSKYQEPGSPHLMFSRPTLKIQKYTKISSVIGSADP